MKYCAKYLFLLVIACILANAAIGSELQEDELIKISNLSPKEQVDTLAKLCWQNREKNTELALELGLKAIELAESTNYKNKLAQLYGYVGVIYQHYKNQTRTAITYYDKSLKYSLETNDSVQLGYVYNNLGDAFYKIGNVPLAKENTEKSMTIFKNINNQRGIAYSSVNLGFVNRINHDYREALKYFRNAIELRKTFHDSAGIASATLELGQTFYEMKEYQEAMNYFKKSLDLHTLLNNKNYMAYSYYGMAEVFFQKNEYDSALVYYQNSLELNRQRNNNSAIINNLLAIALVYGHINMPEKGEQVLQQATDKAQNLNDPNFLLEVYKTSANFFGLLNNFKKASENYQKYISAYDSVFSELQVQNMAEVKNRFQVMEDLNQINEDLKEKQMEFLYLLIISVLLATFAIILILQYRTKAKLTSKLQTSNHTKDKILSIISHDLISPFSGLIGFSELLAENIRIGNYKQAEQYCTIIQKSSKETLDLTKNILNWALTQRNIITLKPEDFDVIELMNEVVNTTNSQAKSKNISVAIATQKSQFLTADRNLLKTVLINLVNNAIKFSREGQEVVLSAMSNEKEITISIKDNGTGIDSELIPKLFDENESVQTAGTNNEKGTGLGLLVCKEFVELHKGKIWVESKKGTGTTFYFTIPI